MTMKYSVELQFADPGRRPEDPGPVGFGFETPGPHLLPDVGDYIQVDTSSQGDGGSDSGRVRSRLFRYIGVSNETHCHVNIVVERDESARWDLVIKE